MSSIFFVLIWLEKMYYYFSFFCFCFIDVKNVLLLKKERNKHKQMQEKTMDHIYLKESRTYYLCIHKRNQTNYRIWCTYEKWINLRKITISSIFHLICNRMDTMAKSPPLETRSSRQHLNCLYSNTDIFSISMAKKTFIFIRQTHLVLFYHINISPQFGLALAINKNTKKPAKCEKRDKWIFIQKQFSSVLSNINKHKWEKKTTSLVI